MKKALKSVDAKTVVLPHSQAKLDLYKNYLLHYLRVLSLANFCTKINLYDIFCGTGLYDDGNIGSPLVANECISETHAVLTNLSRVIKPIVLNINDKEVEKITKVEELLKSTKLPQCSYNFFNEDADEMLIKVASDVNLFPATERNLVFIDPYGYSKINKDRIFTILKNKCSEVILFLPVMQMYRFIDVALTDTQRACYENLRKFIYTFFPSDHKIHSNGIDSIFDYINEIKKALTFDDKFYTCSHYIERDKGNYYALFYITSNIYGLEKMLEAKWKMDPIKGKGFHQKNTSIQSDMFLEEFQEHDKREELKFLSDLILNMIKQQGELNNNEIYEISLINQFRPTHAYSILKELLKGPLKATTSSNPNSSGETGFGINYQNYKDNIIKISFSRK